MTCLILDFLLTTIFTSLLCFMITFLYRVDYTAPSFIEFHHQTTISGVSQSVKHQQQVILVHVKISVGLVFV